ncbi:MAG: dihydropyrimidinase, partial [Pseudomonadota bacterium]
MDLVIKNGTLATASDVFKADIGIQNGVITALAQNLDGAEIIDATDKLVIPGGIDSHVHIAQPSGPGIEMADDFVTGTRSALMGGNTTIMPFCMQERGSSLRAALTGYHALAEGNCYTDVSFHLIISEPTQEVLGQELPAAVADGY